MSGFLLDTNIPSELTRPRPSLGVSRWLDETDDTLMYFSAISVGEILKGITMLPESRRRAELHQWLDAVLRTWFQDRILPVTIAAAERWGILAGECKVKGVTLKVADGLIAATALEHGLTLVTRNAKDFACVGANLLNPWEQT